MFGAWLGARLSRRSAIQIERERHKRAENGTRALIFREAVSNYSAIDGLRAQLEKLDLGAPQKRPDGSTSGPRHSPTNLYYALQHLDVPTFREAAFDGFIQELPHAFDEDTLDDLLDFYDDARSALRKAAFVVSELPASAPDGVMTTAMTNNPEQVALRSSLFRVASLAGHVYELREQCRDIVSRGEPFLNELAATTSPPITLNDVLRLPPAA